MLELIVFAIGVGLGVASTHLGYQNYVAKLKTEALQLEAEFKSYLSTPKN